MQEDKVKLISSECLQQNKIYVDRDPHWWEAERNYDFLLQEYMYFTNSGTFGQTKDPGLWKKLKEGGENNPTFFPLQPVQPSQSPLISYLDTFLRSQAHSSTTGPNHRYVILCLTNLHKQYSTLLQKLETTRFEVQTLHTYHVDVLHAKFKKGFEQFQQENKLIHQDFTKNKTQWTIRTQTELMRWESESNAVFLKLVTWIDHFHLHQKGILAMIDSLPQTVPSDIQQVFRAIHLKTEKIQQYVHQIKFGLISELGSKEQSLLTSLKELHKYWARYEQKYDVIFAQERRQQQVRCDEKLQLVQEEKKQVQRYESQIYNLKLEAEDLVCMVLASTSTASPEMDDVQLRSNLKLRQKMAELEPCLLQHKNRLASLTKELADLNEKRTASSRLLPCVKDLHSLQLEEQALLEKRAQLEQQAAQHVEKLNSKWKQQTSLQRIRLQHLLSKSAEQAHQERRRYEWEHWAKWETSLLEQETHFQNLSKTVKFYGKEWKTLFPNQTDFSTLQSRIHDAWNHLLQTYVKVRMKLHSHHLQNLIAFYMQCYQNLDALSPTNSLPV